MEIGELRLPPNVAIALVIRKDKSFVPAATTRIQHGDEVPRRLRDATERRIRAGAALPARGGSVIETVISDDIRGSQRASDAGLLMVVVA